MCLFDVRTYPINAGNDEQYGSSYNYTVSNIFQYIVGHGGFSGGPLLLVVEMLTVEALHFKCVMTLKSLRIYRILDLPDKQIYLFI